MTKSRARKFADIMGGTFVGLIEDGQIDLVDVDGLSAIQTKVNGIEANATADQTPAQIKTAYESNADTNEFSDAEQSKLAGIEAGATSDQTASEIRSLVQAATDSNVFTDADHSKLNAIEANAKDDQTITAGSGLSGGGTGDVTLSHSGTSSQGSVNNSGATVVQDVTLDGYGHVTGLGSHTLTLANLGYTGATNANYITNNNQLSNGAGYTTNVGDITNVTAGTNLTGGGSSGSVTVNLTASPNITSLNVGGSEVVSSSRSLKNITSVDATTVAALAAAGVGGGGSINELSDGYVSASEPTVSTNPTLGSLWLNSTSGDVYVCTDATAGANVWVNANGVPSQNIPPTLPAATGGQVVTVGDYKRHTFTTSSTFAVTIPGDFNILVVAAGGAGGGAGSSKMGGGGGAGGRRYEPNTALSAGNYSVAVPAGMPYTSNAPNTASAASAGIYDAVGGGQGGDGGGSSGQNTGSDGGSGGGGSYDARAGGSGTLNQGFAGGNSADDAGGGGGGASEAGTNALSGSGANGGAGGDGLASNTSVGFDGATLAGGGGGGGRVSSASGPGGAGGGGDGGDASASTGHNGTANTGGGGGGAGPSGNGGNGGSGVVIITYKFQ